jgi:hypothetical protein
LLDEIKFNNYYVVKKKIKKNQNQKNPEKRTNRNSFAWKRKKRETSDKISTSIMFIAFFLQIWHRCGIFSVDVFKFLTGPFLSELEVVFIL